MNFTVTHFIIGAAIFLVGCAIGYSIVRWKERNLRAAQILQEKTALENSRRDAEALLREARLTANEDALKLREQTEKLFASRRAEIDTAAHRLNERELLVNRQLEKVMQEESVLREKEKAQKIQEETLATSCRKLEALKQKQRQELETISQINVADARARLLKQIEEECQRDAGHLARHILEDAKLRAEEKARKIVSVAIQRYAGQHTFETSTATVALQGDDMKGRIIGREGRNIRAFEAATGITVLIDDTPNAVVLSGFDPVRREIARESMERLILDGRIHPTRIEEVVAKVSREMDETIVRAGEDAVLRAGLPPVHLEIIKVLGRLKFRHSFSQNVLEHSIEVAHLMGLMACELGINVAAAKRAGLLHDIGKAVSHEIEGPHAIVGADLIKRFGESDEVVNGVASHHEEAPHLGVLGILVSAADAISASRPGARSETMTTYIKRVDDLERIGLSFPGVEKCFAVQAGRELRVIVQPDQMDDEKSFALARNIARKIEDELQYPGQIRITVMRETRCVEFAK
ncbi:MAG: ribonuclease Y [Verrucomicrobiota bacterium]